MQPAYAYIGCNTVKDANARKTGNGKGVSVYRIDGKTEAWTLVQVCETLPNPGFLAINRAQTFLYAAHGDYTEISSYAIDSQTGQLAFLNRQPTDGHNSRHLTVDPGNRHVVLNKGTGVAVFPINADGSLAPYCENVVPAKGTQPPRGTDIAPCPHQVVFDPSGHFMVVPDRNLDRIHVYRYDATSGKLTSGDPPHVTGRDWSGPRHIDFHPSKPLAYAINETDSTVTAYHWDAQRGELKPFQVISTIPPDYSGKNSGSEIAVSTSGQYVFASNRGHDSIVALEIDAQYGTLTARNWTPTQGKKPRFFALGNGSTMLYAANQDGNAIVPFAVDNKTGKLTDAGPAVETGSPTCIVFTYR